MKTDFEARTVLLQKENKIKNQFITCFMKLLYIMTKLRQI